MTDEPEAVSTEALLAYVDGVLDAAERQRVEAHLATHPEDATAVRDYQRQNEALRALAGSLERSSGRHTFRLQRQPARWRALRALSWAAAAAALVVLGGAGGWLTRGSLTADRPELYRLAASAYRIYTVQQRHPVEVWANEREHLQTWLGNVLGVPFVAPDLERQGYDLVGGRLLSTQRGAAALLIYQGKDNQRLALYVCTRAAWGGTGKASYEEVGTLGTFTWPKGPLWYSLAGNLSASELKSMAVSVNQQVAGEPAPGEPVAQRR